MGNSGSILSGQNVTPVFDVLYLHKYSHSFSNFNDIVIQIFHKASVMTVATLFTCSPMAQIQVPQAHYIQDQPLSRRWGGYKFALCSPNIAQ